MRSGRSLAQPPRVRVVLAGVYVRERLSVPRGVAVFVASGAVLVLAVTGWMDGAAAAGVPRAPTLPPCGAQLPAITPRPWGPATRQLVPPDPTIARVCSSAVVLTVPPQVVVTFGYASGHIVSVGADLGPCAVATNGSVSRHAVGQYSHLVFDLASDAAVGTRRSRPCGPMRSWGVRECGVP